MDVCWDPVPAPVTILTLPSYVNPQASAIDFRTSSIPNGGLVFEDVIMGGRQFIEASFICRRISEILLGSSLDGTVSAFVTTACTVRWVVWHLCSRCWSMALSISFKPCFALNRMYMRRSLNLPIYKVSWKGQFWIQNRSHTVRWST